MILADTSVWVDHFRFGDKFGDKDMRERLNQGEIAIHPYVIAELALASLRERRKTLALLDLLPQVRLAQTNEVRLVIEARRLHRVGIGLVDAHLIASVFLNSSILLWSRDRKLRRIAEKFGMHAGLA